MKKVLQVCVATFSSFAHAVKIGCRGFCGGEGNGRNITWMLDRDGMLRVTGHGKMMPLSESQLSPWHTIKKYIKSISVEDGVTSIEYKAFSDCSNLTTVTIPSSVIKIGWCAFSGCTSLSSVIIPPGVMSIGEGLFSGCTNLISVVIPSSVTSIGSYAFSGCSNLRSVTIPDSVTSVGGSAFEKCSSLASITIPDSVTSIGWCAFSNCSNLKSVTISKNMTSIEDFAFSGCSNLKSVTIPDSVTSIEWAAFRECGSLASITIPASVTSIGSYAFYGCSNLKSVTIPDSVASIEEEAFRDTAWYNSQPDGIVYAGKCLYKYKGAVPLGTEITVKPGTLSICTKALRNCSGLASIKIPESVTSIGSHAFSGCSGLKSVIVSDGLINIGDYAFNECNTLTLFNVPSSVTNIGDWAFSNCSSLKSVTISRSVTNIGDYVFGNCGELTAITVDKDNSNYSSDECGVLFDKNKTNLIQYPIGNTAISYTIPSSVTSIGNLAFSGCGSHIFLMDRWDTTKFELIDFAFKNCSSLASIFIPSSVIRIDDSAFNCCNSLNAIIVDANNPYFSSDKCGALFDKNKTELIQYPIGSVATSYAIPSSVKRINWNAFENCSKLTAITVDKNNSDYSSDERGVLFNKNKTELIQYPIGNPEISYTIPTSVMRISSYSFERCNSITSVTIPSNVESIHERAFYDCKNLSEIDISNSAIRIENEAFDNTDWYYSQPDGTVYAGKLLYKYKGEMSPETEITVKLGTRGICYGAFLRCSGLALINIPKDVERIGKRAFSECDNLREVRYAGTKKQWDKIVIDDYNEKLKSATIIYNYV